MLINCPECKKEITDKVGTICPNCGHKVQISEEVREEKKKKRKKEKIIGWIFGLTFLGLLITLVS